MAGVISVQQLALATDMRDPLLAAQCRIFAAYSLLQRGRLKPAAKIIKLVAIYTSCGHVQNLE